ncbi:MAG TPA: thiamine pyrophosphate-dependent dehydrogenase E1 component subunit alpha [Pelolinea sp.]|nr:thiamine pyrophosphate-dependent dehydrogenase E1 component subunit alpha [Pelolinea sp.]
MNIELLKRMYRTALTIRRFEEAAIEQYRLGNIYGYLHPYLGEEAIATGAIAAIGPDDYIVSTHRGHGHAIAKGHDVRLMMAELMGRATGYCKGRGGSMHVADLKQKNLGANGIVGGGIPFATGAGMAIKQKKTDQVVISFLSDGAVNNGVFLESINLAAIYHLPVIFIIENNHYAAATPVETMNLQDDLSKYSVGFGIPGFSLDGNDAVKIYEAMQEPVKRARVKKGPTLIECKTYRHRGHHVNDPGLYMPQDVLEHWKQRDPLILLKEYLNNEKAEDQEIDLIEEEVRKLIEKAVKFGLESPEPSPEEFLLEISSL